MRKFLISLAPAAVVAAFALAPSAASAAACTTNVLCNNSNEALRDDAVTPPTGGGYGTSALAVNTAGTLRFCATLLGLKKCNENPTGYAFFGVKLHSNPATSATKCEEATGWVTFVDVQNATTSGAKSPVYDNTSPGSNGAWPISVKSDNTGCPLAERGKVTIEKSALYFPELLGVNATGTFTGKWVQPGECAGGSGGVKLEVKQPGVTLSTGEKPEVDNGPKAENAFICFVSANNYLYPEKAPAWTPLVGNVWKD
jgi:hypothetical protein